MGKFVAHVAVAFAIGFACSALNLHWSVAVVAIVFGLIAVHLVWERLFVGPHLYLGAMPVQQDDPLMQDARRRAKDALPRLRAWFPEHREDTIVRFALRTVDEETEWVWGDLLELGESDATVFLRTPPVGRVDIADRRMTVPLSDVDDWQIEFRDGTLRGGFTNRAMFKIYERENGGPHAAAREQLARFRDD